MQTLTSTTSPAVDTASNKMHTTIQLPSKALLVKSSCPRMLMQPVLRPRVAAASRGDSLFNEGAMAVNRNGGKSDVAKPLAHPEPGVLSPSALLQCSWGVGALLAVNFGLYAMAVWLGKSSMVASLALSTTGAKWWQYASSVFVHVGWSHLMRDLPAIWLAGAMLRKDLSSGGVWFTYVLCGVCANISAMLWLPSKAKYAGSLLGIGATGGATGLLIVAVLLAFRPTLGYLASALLFGHLLISPMLVTPVPGATALNVPSLHTLVGSFFTGGLPGFLKTATTSIKMAAVDPGLTWLWGAGVAALLVVFIARIPDPDERPSPAA